MRITPLVASAFLVAGLAVACEDDDDPTGPVLENDFVATLNGANERPNPVTTTGTGNATVTIGATSLTVTVNITSALTNITLAHIHIGTTSAAGPIIVNLLPVAPAAGPFTGQLVSGTFSTVAGSAPVSFDGLVDLIRNGDAYINVHTTANGGGEIRGQLVPAT